ncbi:MAG: Poly-beta-hydroxybutyrate polymerase [Candidatus Accumulibacter appositus]|uniref:Poly-beta-hydroxybutyrate polymerase n=1 Tax=Candidatus Accumulibacter appositus TaxID=1454003 RepID=A0A011PV61_9PROT|nr:class I poly(R)-hydroxyalkanoic acid synthase [Accumulibacter sp.]EXI80720.1 MAG: Poly-beta-hydroxybutyrate polymerase [Candidatus Accumulibacter appositus]HRF06543.1 class I poly(R)-hydroxyalkanoic acid synthase [Accumulibacter sp.]
MTLPPASAQDRSLPAPAEVANSYLEVAQRASRLLRRHMKKTARKGLWFPSEEFELAKAFMDLSAGVLASPYRLAQTQMAVMRDHIQLWQQSTLRRMGMPFHAVASPDADDLRFDDEAWEDNFLFDFIKQSYLITARHLQQAVARAEGLDETTQQRVTALTRKYIDALSPTNFALTNPEVLRATVESKGKNLLKGLKHLLKDLAAGDEQGLARLLPGKSGGLRLGEDLASTPGKVIYQNELLQLIQYQPAGSHQHRKPLLIVPPWINKYYLFDLRESNSFVRWASEQGFTTFIISWVDPDPRLAQKSFSDYLVDGVLAAIDAVEQATGEKQIDLVGYCLGGTLLMATLAWMAAHRDKRAASATFLGTLIDFSEPGELATLADAAAAAKSKTTRSRDRNGAKLANTYRMLRANDLIWSFVVNNYLLGRERFPLEQLHWNADATRMPTALHRFYVENFYLGNKLCQPGGISLAGVDIDVSRVKLPCYFLATIEDHIAPWKSAYSGAQLPAGPVKFVLGGSGHLAGTINPPAAMQHGYWTNASSPLPEQADNFLTGATRHHGSWWPDWQQWLLAQADGSSLVVARQPGERALKAIEDAPGSYAAGRGIPPAAD